MDVDEDARPASMDLRVSLGQQTLPDVLSRVWTNREIRVERQDEDLFSRPPSPVPDLFESSMEQDLNRDEVELSDLSTESEEEEPRTSVHLTATQRLNTEFELQAARAGMCACYLKPNDTLLTRRTSSTATGPKRP